MTSRIEKPRILILGGALEYQRVSDLLSSFDTLLHQEMDDLKMLVANIDAHQPYVLRERISLLQTWKILWTNYKENGVVTENQTIIYTSVPFEETCKADEGAKPYKAFYFF